MMTVAIACGGTGGHLFPGIAVAEELARRGHKSLLIISEKKVDLKASKKYAHFEFITQPSRPKPRLLSLQIVPFLFSLLQTTRHSKALFKKRKIDAVIGMGGFTCFGPLLAAKNLHIPSYIHDSNAVPGKTNRFLARYVDRVLLGLEPARTYFEGKPCQVVGTPLRDEMKVLPPRAEAARQFGLDPQRKTVLVFGGSQGAQKLNTLAVEAAQQLPELQFLHIAGSADYDRVSELGACAEHHHVLPFCEDMPAAYAAADLVICRSGASSLTELSFLGLPALLVPYPFAADDHQTKNAEAYSQKGAALLQQERDLEDGALPQLLRSLMDDPAQLTSLSEKMRALSLDPAAAICDLITQS